MIRVHLLLQLSFTLLFLSPKASHQYACDKSVTKTSKYPFCNTYLPYVDHAKDLVSHLTLEEKVKQLVNKATGIPKLGVSSHEWWNEALHGVAVAGSWQGVKLPGATSFPAPYFLLLVLMHHCGACKKLLMRVEIALLTCSKFPVAVSTILHMILKTGKVLIDSILMQRVNGVPSCADADLLKGIVREQWALDGYIVSDCDATEKYYKAIGYTATPEDAVALALNAGVNLDCNSYLKNYTAKAVNMKKVEESVVDQALIYNYLVLMRLGFFDGDPAEIPILGKLGPSYVCSADHQNWLLMLQNRG
ncbi:hypothetical protein Ancab_017623 [Ancistrocladus abbreviatus]